MSENTMRIGSSCITLEMNSITLLQDAPKTLEASFDSMPELKPTVDLSALQAVLSEAVRSGALMVTLGVALQSMMAILTFRLTLRALFVCDQQRNDLLRKSPGKTPERFG